MLRILAVALLALPAPFAAAQNHWIVDVQNAPGAHFTQIRAALNAAQVVHGDVLHVRPGTYQAFATSKGVAILGRGAVIDGTTGTSLGAAVVVSNIPAGRSVALVGLLLLHYCGSSTMALLLQNNAGTVHCEDVSTQGSGSPSWLFPMCPSVLVDQCALVTWNGGSLLGGGGFQVQYSSLAISRVTAHGLRGQDLGFRHISSTAGVTTYGGGTVHVASSNLRGGDGSGNVGPSPGIWALGFLATDEVVVAGDARNTIQAGTHVAVVPTPGILLTSGHALRYDPAATILGSHGGPAISGGSPTAEPIAEVQAANAIVGGSMIGFVRALPGDFAFLALAIPSAPVPLPVELLCLDLATLIPMFVGSLGPNGTAAAAVAVPVLPALRGLQVAWQAAHLDAARGTSHLTNPVVVVIE